MLLFFRSFQLTWRTTADKMSKYAVISNPYFPAFELNSERYDVSPVCSANAGKYGLEINLYLDTFQVVHLSMQTLTLPLYQTLSQRNVPRKPFISLLFYVKLQRVTSKPRRYFSYTSQKKKFPTKNLFSKCEQIRRNLWFWSH